MNPEKDPNIYLSSDLLHFVSVYNTYYRNLRYLPWYLKRSSLQQINFLLAKMTMVERYEFCWQR